MANEFKLFDYLNSINHEKNHLLDDGDEHVEKAYPPFVANLSMSLRMDTIMYANDMNMRHQIPNKWNYDYYFYGLDKAKRFAKWPKKKKSEDSEVVAKFYNCSMERAEEYLSLLSDADLNTIKRKSNTGGRV